MTEQEAIKKSIEHWERMRDWAGKQELGTKFGLSSMVEDIGDRLVADDCALCRKHRSFSFVMTTPNKENCTDCPLVPVDCCMNANSIYGQAVRAKTTTEFYQTSEKMVKVLKSLLKPKPEMLCCYVAGAYSADNVLRVLDNMREGIRLSSHVLVNGIAPFCPWLDYHFQLNLVKAKLTVEDYYNYSIAWLKKSDCMLLVPGWENSEGTKREVEIAKEMGLPVYESMRDLMKFKKIWESREVK